jgi:hypothetical protein
LNADYHGIEASSSTFIFSTLHLLVEYLLGVILKRVLRYYRRKSIFFRAILRMPMVGVPPSKLKEWVGWNVKKTEKVSECASIFQIFAGLATKPVGI